jgi:hypothetical protein
MKNLLKTVIPALCFSVLGISNSYADGSITQNPQPQINDTILDTGTFSCPNAGDAGFGSGYQYTGYSISAIAQSGSDTYTGTLLGDRAYYGDYSLYIPSSMVHMVSGTYCVQTTLTCEYQPIGGSTSGFDVRFVTYTTDWACLVVGTSE